METPLTLNNAHVHELIIFLKVRFQSKSTLGCYIIETAASITSNNAPYER